MAVGQRVDPFDNFNFKVEIDGIVRAAFQQCSGFDSTIDVIEHREGGENTTPRKLPGLTKYSNISLKWGITDDMELYSGIATRCSAGCAAGTAPSCSSTAKGTSERAGISSTPGLPSTTAPTSMRKATMWRSRRWSSRTKASNG